VARLPRSGGKARIGHTAHTLAAASASSGPGYVSDPVKSWPGDLRSLFLYGMQGPGTASGGVAPLLSRRRRVGCSGDTLPAQAKGCQRYNSEQFRDTATLGSLQT
jgi:hypothetical protein